MEYRFSVHTHTDAVDGRDSAEKMAAEAIRRGMKAVGFAEHARQRIDQRYGLTTESEKAYIKAVNAVKQKYAGILTVRLGIERDAYSTADRSDFEYVLGSLHYIEDSEKGITAVDGRPEDLRRMVQEWFGGDGVAMTSAYYRALAEYISDYRPDIIGHFDLVTKHNADGSLFDENCAEYRRTALKALETCAMSGAVLEINTGAIARGFRADPYPAQFLLNAWREMGGSVTVGMDAHRDIHVDYGFDTALQWARQASVR